jgi:hypothetical protein
MAVSKGSTLHRPSATVHWQLVSCQLLVVSRQLLAGRGQLSGPEVIGLFRVVPCDFVDRAFQHNRRSTK